MVPPSIVSSPQGYAPVAYNSKTTMSSFEQFKKSQHSKSNRSSRLSFKSFEVDAANLANVSFNTSEIVFRWA
jgi:hypothetical protein